MFFYTKHAIEKMDALGIFKSEIEKIILKGMKWKRESNEKWYAQMAGIEVIFMKENKDFVVITVYLAGREK